MFIHLLKKIKPKMPIIETINMFMIERFHEKSSLYKFIKSQQSVISSLTLKFWYKCLHILIELDSCRYRTMSRQTKIDWHETKVQLLKNYFILNCIFPSIYIKVNTRFILPMENSVSSSLSSSTTTITSPPSFPAASLANLFLNEINYQDVHGLLDVQRSLYVIDSFSHFQQ